MNYYEIMGLSIDCTREELHHAFRDLSKQYHPDRFEEGLRPSAERRYRQMVKAFNVLKDPGLREKYDQTLVRERVKKQENAEAADPDGAARKYHTAGLARFQQGNYRQAVDLFNRALQFKEIPETYFYKGMAEFKLPDLKKLAIESLQRAVALNNRQLGFHLQLVRALMESGMQAHAATAAEKALSIFPDDAKLLALDEQLHPEKYKKAGLGGLLGNIFGKK